MPPGAGPASPSAAPPPSSGVAPGGTARPPASNEAEGGQTAVKTKRGTRVVEGRNDRAAWYVDAWYDKGTCKVACLRFAFRAGNGGGGVDAYRQELPLGVSLAQTVDTRFAWGLASSQVVRVRFEHTDVASEMFETVGPPGSTERFYAGVVAPTPFTRIVGLDSAGTVVAEYDVNRLNGIPAGPQ